MTANGEDRRDYKNNIPSALTLYKSFYKPQTEGYYKYKQKIQYKKLFHISPFLLF